MLGKVGKLLTRTVRYGTVFKVDRAEGCKYLNCKKRKIEVKIKGKQKGIFFRLSLLPFSFFLSFLPDSFLPLSSGYHDIPTYLFNGPALLLLGNYSYTSIHFFSLPLSLSLPISHDLGRLKKCASVLSTQSSKLHLSSSSNKR